MFLFRSLPPSPVCVVFPQVYPYPGLSRRNGTELIHTPQERDGGIEKEATFRRKRREQKEQGRREHYAIKLGAKDPGSKILASQISESGPENPGVSILPKK